MLQPIMNELKITPKDLMPSSRIEFVRIVSLVKELKKKEYFNTLTDEEKAFYTYLKNTVQKSITNNVVSDTTKTWYELYRNTDNFSYTLCELIFNYSYFAPTTGTLTKGKLTLHNPTYLYGELFLLASEQINLFKDSTGVYILYNNNTKHFLFGEDKGCTCSWFNYNTGLKLTEIAINTHNEKLRSIINTNVYYLGTTSLSH